MAYFRTLSPNLEQLDNLLVKTEYWAILINADPDAMSSAMALKRLMNKKVKCVDILRINAITRPDNLAMIRNLRIKMSLWEENMVTKYDKFAIVDSQPHHSPAFSSVNFSIIIDHHPILTENSVKECEKKGNELNLIDIRPNYGSTATMLTEYLYHAKIKPSKMLATALQYGIRTDTGVFGRQCTETDLRAYNYLSRYADQNTLTRIIKSEYLPQWLPYFSRAFATFRPCGLGHFAYLANVDSPDILVVIADFFLKIHGLRYIVVAGVYNQFAICIFRGSNVNLGLLAQKSFAEYGSAGGHKVMARAEIPLQNLNCPINCEHEKEKFNLKKKSLSKSENTCLENFLYGRLKECGNRENLK